MGKLKCVRRNNLGECIEVVEEGDTVMAKFREEDKNCNPELYEKFKEKAKEGKIRVYID